MADLILTDEHKQYQELARDFAAKEIAPHAHQFDGAAETPADVYKKAWEIGLFNVVAPEELGGLGLGTWDACVMAEEIGAACLGTGVSFWANEVAISHLLIAGSPVQKENYISPLLDKFSFAAYCFSDPQWGCTVTYKRSADSFVLTGAAPSLNAKAASWLVVTAVNQEHGEPTTFIVPADAKGLQIGDEMHRVGLKAADLRMSVFDSVSLSQHNVVGKPGDASHVETMVAAKCSPILAAYTAGLIRCALDNSVTYSKQRYSMGKPIASHQAVAFMLADIARDYEASRLLAWKAAWLCDNRLWSCHKAEQAITFASDAAMRATTDAVQIYGGYGYSREYPVEKLMRDAKTLQILFGGGSDRKMQLGKGLLESVAATLSRP